MDEGGSKRQGYSQNQLVWHIRVQRPLYCNSSSTSPQQPLGTEESDRYQEVAVVEKLKQESIYGPVSDPDLEIGGRGLVIQTLTDKGGRSPINYFLPFKP